MEMELENEIVAALERMSASERAGLERLARAAIARQNDSPEGFEQFYRLIFGRAAPRHALEWVRDIYAAQAESLGTVIEAFRGSSKTTTLTIALTAFRIGHAPHKSTLLVQVGDEIAKDNAQMIAGLIERNAGWRLVFPHIAPDYEIGWGSTGYEVKRIDMSYAAWRSLAAQSKGKDPTFVGVGYRSRAIIGKHPTGMLLVDDIHDEHNTSSARELDMVIKVVTGTILPTVTPQTWKVFIGTPWARNDVLAYAKSTGAFKTIRTPVYQVGDLTPPHPRPLSIGDGEGSARVLAAIAQQSLKPSQSDGRGEAVSTWPEMWTPAEIEKQRRLAGESEFARMFLLDLEAASGAHLKREWLHAYPVEKIHPSWPVVMGVDYASAADQLDGARRDYFAVAIGRVLPGGAGVVLTDGFRGRVSQGEAEQRLKELAAQYPTLQLIGVEAVGKGEEFFHLMLRTSRLPLKPVQAGRRGKGERFERGMAPLFEFSRAWVADVETPFLRAFRDEWTSWPHAEHDDTLDAVYWMLFVAPGNLLGGETRRAPRWAENPFMALGRS